MKSLCHSSIILHSSTLQPASQWGSEMLTLKRREEGAVKRSCIDSP